MNKFFPIACLFLCMLSLWPVKLQASGLRNIQDAWLLPTRDVVWLLRADHSAENITNGRGSGSGVWALAGTMQLFSMPELPVRMVGIGMRVGGPSSSWILGGIWQRTGQTIFNTDDQMLTMGWEKNWRFNIQLARKSWVIGSEPMPAWVGLMFLCEPPPVTMGSCALRGEFLIPLWASGDWRDHMARQGRYKLILTTGKLALVGAMEKKAYSGWALGLELSLAVGSRIGVTVRADPDTGSIGPGTVWMWGRFLLKTSHIVHPELGLSHRFTLATGALGAIPW